MDIVKSSNREAAPFSSRNRQGLKLGACMGAFSQLFDWNRVLGSKSLATTLLPPEVSNIPCRRDAGNGRIAINKSRKGQVADCISSIEASMADLASIKGKSGASSHNSPTELRQLLYVKQEPFVLQDVIHEKKHPVRRKEIVSYEGKRASRSKNRSKSATTEKLSSAQSAGPASMTLTACLSTSAADESRQEAAAYPRGPVESIVAMPSSQQFGTMKALAKSAASRAASSSANKSPLKSPNKKALLMEAAVKILEGSSRRSSKQAATARCLLLELDSIKAEFKLANSSNGGKLSEKLLNSTSVLKDLNKIDGGGPRNKSSPSRIENPLSSGAMPKTKRSASKARSTNFASTQCSLDFERELAERLEKEYASQSTCSGKALAFNVSGRRKDQQKDGVKADGPSTVGDGRSSCIQEPLAVAATDNDSNFPAAIHDSIRVAGGEAEGSPSRLPRLSHLPCDTDRMSIHDGQLPPDDVELTNKASRTTSLYGCLLLSAPYSRALGREISECPVREEDLSKANAHIRQSAAVDACDQSSTEQKLRTLRICNFSWWEQKETCMEAKQVLEVRKDQRCDVDSEPDALLTAVKSPPFLRRVFDKGTVIDQAHTDTNDCTCVDECQQFSPVSVLDAAFNSEEDSPPTNGHKSFSSFEESRQHLLENVRRFELLAQMDLETLMKYADECEELEEEDENDVRDAVHIPISKGQEQAPEAFLDDRVGDYHCRLLEKGNCLSVPEAEEWDKNDDSFCCFEGRANNAEDLYLRLQQEPQSRAWKRSSAAVQKHGSLGPAGDGVFFFFLDHSTSTESAEASSPLCLPHHDPDHAAVVKSQTAWITAPTEVRQQLEQPSCCHVPSLVGDLMVADIRSRDQSWRDFSMESDELVVEIESYLIDHLLKELAFDLKGQI